MSSSTPSHRLLLDENVHHKLAAMLRAQGCDIRVVPKGSTDQTVARISLHEQRIVLTNDSDFRLYRSDQIYGVIWLRMQQHSVGPMAEMIAKVLKKRLDFQGRLIMITPTGWKAFPLAVPRV